MEHSMMDYVDLEIGLHRYDTDAYAVELRFSQPGSDADVRPARDTLPLARFDFARLRELELDISGYGQCLAAGLFADSSVLATFAHARGAAGTLDVPLRVRLYIGPGLPELHRLRWETLCDPQNGTSLCTADQVLFSRYLSSDDWRPVRLRPKGDLRALVVVANPSDLGRYKPGGVQLGPIDVAAEVARAKLGLGAMATTTLESGGSATLSAIAEHLRDGYDILYIVAHGAIVKGESLLWLENANGGVAVTPGSELMTILRESPHCPRLVVLISCQSAGNGYDDTFSALGPRLAAGGAPAVLAMQSQFSMATSATFMEQFFKELQRDGQIDRATAVARGAIRDRADAWMPALFMRLKSGRIWYVPGFAEDQKGFRKWPALLNSIQRGRCTPILGAGLLEPLLGSTREIARHWAEAYAFPMEPHEREDLPQVAQYLAVNQDAQFPRDQLGELLCEEIMQRFGSGLPKHLRSAQAGQIGALLEAAGAICRARDPADPHGVLANLPFPIYITTNPDNLLEAALSAVGKQPQVAICPWNDYVESSLAGYDDEPTPQRPLVYHLFGDLREPDSLVLTEDNYFDFLIGVTRNNHLIPDVVREALADTSLLFLGFQMDDWNFRVLFRSLMSREGRVRRSRYAHVAVQINPDEGRILEPERARQYLESYFQDADMSIYWGSSEDFIQDLHRRAPPVVRDSPIQP
jgi:hypothetical protein